MTLTRLQRTVSATALILLFGMLALAPAMAQQSSARSLAWQRFDVDLDLHSDASMVVTETQAIQFSGTYQQGYRLVPLDRTTGAADATVAELVDGRSVAYTRGSGRPDTYAASVSQGGLQVDWWFPPTTNVTRTFVVRYVVSGPVRIYNAGDQLQWRAVYADRDGPVGPSSVTVHLPAAVDPAQVQSAWYALPAGGIVGALRPTASGTQIDPRTVRFDIGQLAPRTGAEIRVQFPHGIIAAPPPAWQTAADRADWLAQTVAPIGDFLALLLSLAILAGGGTLLLLLWFSSGRDPGIGAVPPRLQEPPSDLPAPLAGTLVDEVASEQEAVATLVDLADRGLVHLTDEQNPQLLGSQTDVRIVLVAPLDDSRVRGYERVLLAALFGPAPSVPAEVLLSNVKTQFHAGIPAIEARLYDSVTQAGLFTRNPETTRRGWQAIGLSVLLVGVVLTIGVPIALAGAVTLAWLPGLALTLIGGVLTWLAGLMPRRSQRGAIEAARWRAFRTHLAETVRADAPAVALPEHYLAYAVAFGVEQSFVRHLENVGTPPPAWFSPTPGPGGVVFLPGGLYGRPWLGGGSPNGPVNQPGLGGVAAPPAPNAQGWSDALAALLNAASEAMAHGGGSGGWSGGGFGGGGGGGGGSGGFR